MTTNQRIRAKALQVAIHTLALYPREYLDEMRKQNQNTKHHADMYLTTVTAIAQKYTDCISEGAV
jgi:hypothetical protein